MGLAPFILSALRTEGYERPTPIQAQSIPALLEGRDLLGLAQTGTGKTAAFALPLIHLLSAKSARPSPRSARCLVVAPTRELAAQIDASFAAYSRGGTITRACIFGGVGANPQKKALERGVDVLVATPGRLLDLVGQGALTLSSVEHVVFDEADRMFDMGFIRDLKRIVALLPSKRQSLLFSATMPKEIASLAEGVMRNPHRVHIDPELRTADNIHQRMYRVAKAEKKACLLAVIAELNPYRSIVFTKTKHGANKLARGLVEAGIKAEPIHANKSQNARTRTMQGFKSGDVAVLVATDLASRGIDVDGIDLVVNFDLPTEPETYVHRIGRTARAGASGKAVSFCDPEENRQLRDIERLLGGRIPEARVKGIEAFSERLAAAEIAAASANAAKSTSVPLARGRGHRQTSPEPRRESTRESKRSAESHERTAKGKGKMGIVHEGIMAPSGASRRKPDDAQARSGNARNAKPRAPVPREPEARGEPSKARDIRDTIASLTGYKPKSSTEAFKDWKASSAKR